MDYGSRYHKSISSSAPAAIWPQASNLVQVAHSQGYFVMYVNTFGKGSLLWIHTGSGRIFQPTFINIKNKKKKRWAHRQLSQGYMPVLQKSDIFQLPNMLWCLTVLIRLSVLDSNNKSANAHLTRFISTAMLYSNLLLQLLEFRTVFVF